MMICRRKMRLEKSSRRAERRKSVKIGSGRRNCMRCGLLAVLNRRETLFARVYAQHESTENVWAPQDCLKPFDRKAADISFGLTVRAPRTHRLLCPRNYPWALLEVFEDCCWKRHETFYSEFSSQWNITISRERQLYFLISITLTRQATIYRLCTPLGNSSPEPSVSAYTRTSSFCRIHVPSCVRMIPSTKGLWVAVAPQEYDGGNGNRNVQEKGSRESNRRIEGILEGTKEIILEKKKS